MSAPAEFDLSFRPASYWATTGPVAAIRQNVKGELRREMITDVLEATGEKRAHYDGVGLGELASGLSDPDAPPGFVDALAQVVGPRALGGEFLPAYRTGEVEIARLVLESTTEDVYSVRARSVGPDSIVYRIKDEYGGLWSLTPRASTQPLTLGELISLIDSARVEGGWYDSDDLTDALRNSDAQGARTAYEIANARRFVTVHSDVYTQLAAWYRAKADAWETAKLRALGLLVDWDEDDEE